jgi:Tfp pilus assembly protein PilF
MKAYLPLVILFQIMLPQTKATSADMFQPDIASALVEQVDQAREKQNAKDFASAEVILQTVLSSQPDYYRATHNLGLVYQAKGDTEKALELLNKAKEIATKNSIFDPLIYNSIGWTYLLAGRYDEAEKTLLEGLRATERGVANPSDDVKLTRARILNSLGFLYVQRGDTASARRYLQMSLDDYGTVGASSVLDIVNRVDAKTAKPIEDADPDKNQIVVHLFSNDQAQREDAYKKVTTTELRRDPAVVSEILKLAESNSGNEAGLRMAVVTLRDMSRTATQQAAARTLIEKLAGNVAAKYPQLQKETDTLRDWLNTPEQTQHDKEPPVSTVKVVSIHVGGNDSRSGTYKYDAPPGYRIKNVKLRERSKGGDARYSQKVLSPTHLEVGWSVKSRWIKGPFNMPINTITAFLTLDAEITLEPASAG